MDTNKERKPITPAQLKCYMYFIKKGDKWAENYEGSGYFGDSKPLFSYTVLQILVSKGYLMKQKENLNAYERQRYKAIP